jgi:hypothetical protein
MEETGQVCGKMGGGGWNMFWKNDKILKRLDIIFQNR